MGEIQRSTKEVNKPTPVSMREYMLMDRHEQRVFHSKMTRSEKKVFGMQFVREYTRMPLVDKREIAKAQVEKLSQRPNSSLGDKIELAQARAYAVNIHLPEKKPIFFRKLRTKEIPLPKMFREANSPYLIAPKA